jgi:hypothetical protein
MVGRSMVLLSAVGALALCGCGGKSAPPKAVVIDRDSAAGKHAAAEASGKSGRFSTISVSVRATPNQPVTGSWSVGCRSGSGTASSRDADNFRGRTPLTVAVGYAHFRDVAMECLVVGDAALSRSGRVTVELLGR